MNQVERKLYSWKAPYDHNGSSGLFLQAVRNNLVFHQKHCESYRQLMRAENFSPGVIRSEADLFRIPAIPTVYYKHHTMLSVAKKELKIRALSSGTSGRRSFVGFDADTCMRAKHMLAHFFCWNQLVSAIPANYLILGVKPEKGQQAGAYKTLSGATKLAPAVRIEYTGNHTAHQIIAILERYQQQRLPVRILGFPVFLEQLLHVLEQADRTFHFVQGSKIIIGGGFKQQAGTVRDEKSMQQRVRNYLNISGSQVFEFFSLVEHPIPYRKCRAGHFHVPVYSRVLIRDSDTLEPLGYGKPGLLNLITPLVNSMPLVSVITDDFAAAYPEGSCRCGNPAPYFKWIGRAGVDDIRTCAAQAAAQSGGKL
ncbi:MAG: acyl-protein synthetase [Lachnospiraceae bacterium]